MNKECIVFPTVRNIRTALEQNGNGFLPHYITMGDFLQRVVRFDGKAIPDHDLRVLALHQASRFERFSGLKIERNFFTFLQNSQYIFRFLEELATEMIDIDMLNLADTYAEYEEHITILKELREHYRTLCQEKGWADPIFISENGKINHEFLTQFTLIRIHIEGYLSRYEIELLEECAQHAKIVCHYTTTPYNRKMSERLKGLGFDLKEDYAYQLSLGERKILEEIPFQSRATIDCEIFQHRMTQVGFVKSSIEKMVAKGVNPSKIAVVLPEEGFARYLRLFNEEGNFNFAMGEPLADHRMVKEMEAIIRFLDENTSENRARLTRIPHEVQEWLITHYYAAFHENRLDEMVELLKRHYPDEEIISILDEEHYAIRHLYSAFETMDFKIVFRLFLNRIKEKSIDDVRGGKITVMGLLETRGEVFDGVVVVDFNESYVPHRSQKDLFLNSKIREMASLPTSYDRESLQKHYYSMLFNRSKYVSIGCVENQESIPSRFLMQLGIGTRRSELNYEAVMFPSLFHRERQKIEYEGEYDFTKVTLSASRLKLFLSCKRAYYYRFIHTIKEHQIPRDMSEEREIGNEIHRVMEALYQERQSYHDVDAMKQELERIWSMKPAKDAMERHLRAYWKEKLDPFFHREIKRFHEGYRVLHHEKECEALVEGIRLVGRVDRIDLGIDGLEIIDYKTGKYPSTDHEPKESDVDYQLSVYALIAQELGKVSGCAFYDLNLGELKFERYLEAKQTYLREILRTMSQTKTWVWTMCDDLKTCRYCPYAHLCNREL